METKKIRKIVMTVNREMLTFLIADKNVYYTDRKFGMLIRILPKPKNLLLTIMKTRNRIPMMIATLFELSKEELSEYKNAKDVNALADIIIRDGKKNGCLLVANADMEVGAEIAEKILSQEVIA